MPGCLCEHKTDLYTVSISADQAAYNVTTRLTAGLYHQPELVSAGETGMEGGIWEMIIRSAPSGLSFSADLGDDGEEGVVVAAAVRPRSEFDGNVWAGSTLLNDGDFTYSRRQATAPRASTRVRFW